MGGNGERIAIFARLSERVVNWAGPAVTFHCGACGTDVTGLLSHTYAILVEQEHAKVCKGFAPSDHEVAGDGNAAATAAAADPSRTLAHRRPQNFQTFLLDVRMRASNSLTDYICGFDKEADPADVHEDVREDLASFFEEIRCRVQGPLCDFSVPIGTNAAASCDLLAGHAGNHHPCVGIAQ